MKDESTPTSVLSVPKRPNHGIKRESKELPGNHEEEHIKIIRKDVPTESSTSDTVEDKLGYHYQAAEFSKLSRNASEMAVAASEKDTEPSLDHRSIRETAARVHSATLSGQYIGKTNYYQYIERHDTVRANALSDKNFRAGPMRTSTNIRNTCRFDYAPDLCKDYNETGFCGFGDSCKFLHDRGDYKAGWEIDAEWGEQQQKRSKDLEQKPQDQEIEESPVKPDSGSIMVCGICDQEFTKPVVETKCGHKFCEKCALSHARKSTNCKVCNTLIDGQFRIVKINKP